MEDSYQIWGSNSSREDLDALHMYVVGSCVATIKKLHGAKHSFKTSLTCVE